MDAQLQDLDGRTADVVVVGGGLAGLAAAATAARADATMSVVLLDVQGGGGHAATDEVGRYKFNRGAHALYKGGPAQRVLKELGVRISGANPPLKGARARLGDHTGSLPLGAMTLARTNLLGGGDKVRLGKLLAGLGRIKPAKLSGITIADWLDDRGLEGTARQFTEMLVRLTTYSNDPGVISADVVLAQLQAALSSGVEYLHNGWGTMVSGLTTVARDHGVRIATGARVTAVVPDGRSVRVELGEDVLQARRVIIAAGSPQAAAALLPGIDRTTVTATSGSADATAAGDGAGGLEGNSAASSHPRATPNGMPVEWQRLGPPTRTACLDLGLRETPEVQLMLGIDQPIYMICHAPAAAGLAPRGGATVQFVRYLSAAEDPSADASRAAFAEHAAIAGIDVDRAEESRYLHRMPACTAQPTPAGGGLRGRPAVDSTGVDNVLVAGDWVGPEGYLADASLASGAAAGRAAVEGLAAAPTVHAAGGTAG